MLKNVHPCILFILAITFVNLSITCISHFSLIPNISPKLYHTSHIKYSTNIILNFCKPFLLQFSFFVVLNIALLLSVSIFHSCVVILFLLCYNTSIKQRNYEVHHEKTIPPPSCRHGPERPQEEKSHPAGACRLNRHESLHSF